MYKATICYRFYPLSSNRLRVYNTHYSRIKWLAWLKARLTTPLNSNLIIKVEEE